MEANIHVARRYHERHYHPENPEAYNLEVEKLWDNLKCPYAGCDSRSFMAKAYLSRHIKTVHEKKRSFSCTKYTSTYTAVTKAWLDMFTMRWLALKV